MYMLRRTEEHTPEGAVGRTMPNIILCSFSYKLTFIHRVVDLCNSDEDVDMQFVIEQDMRHFNKRPAR